MNENEFREEVKKLGVEVDEAKLQLLRDYYQKLKDYNEHTNLTAIINEEDVYLKHFYDSLTIVKEINLNNIETLCDVGSGAGFPGIVLKIVYPNLKITLLDSLLKRVNYLNDTIKKLNLKNIVAIHTRSEDYQEKFDLVTARAVANLSKLLGFTMHLVKKDGLMIAMKANIDEEIKNINNDLKKYNCKILKINKFTLPKENSNRALITIKNI